jgi:hypothetical protein
MPSRKVSTRHFKRAFEPNGVIDFDARYLLEADDGAIIYLENRGYRWARNQTIAERMGRNEPVGFDDYYMRVTPRFDAPAGPHEWLSKHVFVGVAEKIPGANRIHYFVVRRALDLRAAVGLIAAVFIAGGLVAIVYIVARRLVRAARPSTSRHGNVPYGVAVVAGAFLIFGTQLSQPHPTKYVDRLGAMEAGASVSNR